MLINSHQLLKYALYLSQQQLVKTLVKLHLSGLGMYCVPTGMPYCQVFTLRILVIPKLSCCQIHGV